MNAKDKESILKQLDIIEDIGELSDGFHTYNSLYYQRLILFATIVNMNPDISWKSLKHEDGELCFGGGWFIVGIDTPEGSYTYHYEYKDYGMFQCQELPVAKHWDGHTDKDVTRLLSLPYAKFRRHSTWAKTGQSFVNPNRFLCYLCPICGTELPSQIRIAPNFCPTCGCDMRKTPRTEVPNGTNC